MNQRIEPYVSATIQAFWSLSPLLVAFVVIGFFEENVVIEALLLPEWGFMSVFLLVAATQKKMSFYFGKRNGLQLTAMSLHAYSALSIIAAVLFAIALMRGRNYIEFGESQDNILIFLNLTVGIGAILLYCSSHVRHYKDEQENNGSFNSDAEGGTKTDNHAKGETLQVKQIVVGMWILATGSYLWFMSKAEPQSLLVDWFIFIFTLFSAAFAGHILIRLLKVRWHESQWSDLAGLGALFFLGIVIILAGVGLSAIEALGSAWPGFIVAILGIPYFYWVLHRIEQKFKQLRI